MLFNITSYDGLMCFLNCGMDGKVCRYQAARTAHQKRGENRAIWLDVGFIVLVIAKILIAVLPDVNRFLQLMGTFPKVPPFNSFI